MRALCSIGSAEWLPQQGMVLRFAALTKLGLCWLPDELNNVLQVPESGLFNMLLIGPPGTVKSMLAKRLTTVGNFEFQIGDWRFQGAEAGVPNGNGNQSRLSGASPYRVEERLIGRKAVETSVGIALICPHFPF
jgi:hypothetical protein